MEASEKPYLPYLLAVGLGALALLLSWLVSGGSSQPLYFGFIAAIAVASWWGGWRPGAFALALNFAAVAGWKWLHGVGVSGHDLAFGGTAVLLWAMGASAQASTSELKKSSRKLSGVVQISEDAIISIDESQAITLFNPGAEKIFGWRAEEMLGRPIHELLPERFRSMHSSHTKSFMHSSDVLRPMGERAVLYGLRRDGTEFPAEASISRFRAGSEMVLTVRLRDISQRLEAEKGLHQLAAIVNSSEDAIMGQTLDGVITAWNPGAEKLFGYSAEEIIGVNVAILLPPKLRDEWLQQTRRVQESGSWRGETARLRKDGRQIDVALTISLMKSHQGSAPGLSIVARDITERKRLEELLRQSQKMEAIGRLAGGVAHDFNNLLSVIVGYSYLIQTSSAPDQKPYQSAQEIMNAASRAGSLTRQLLAFSRKQVLQPEVLDLNTILDTMDKMLPRLIGEDVDVRLVRGESLRRVKLDPVQIEQVIMNLVVNSRDAMPNGGKLTIETSNVYFGEREAVHHRVSPGHYVMLAVTDTGQGMDPETQKLIFEPFFTTKEAGKGTGLGLATVYGIVSQAKGHIWVYSEPGNGTTFKIYFPTTSESAAEAENGGQPRPALCGSETVLAVEDSELLRNLIVQFLKESGYRVIAAADGTEALRLAAAEPGPIDLLLTDVVMPNMGGQELADQIARKYSGVRVLFMSGYTNGALRHQNAIESERSFLQKPFSPDLLLTRVREVLDRPLPASAAKAKKRFAT